MNGVIRNPRRTNRAPIPTGPPILSAEPSDAIRSAPRSSKEIGTWPAAAMPAAALA